MQIHVELRGPAAGAYYRDASILAALNDGRRHAGFIAACRLGRFVTHDVTGHDQVEPASLAACDASGGGEKAPIEPPKMTLGPCHGGAVRPADPGDLVMVGEGIETCLAAMQAGDRPAWAALSTSSLRSLDLPVNVRNVIGLAAADEPGEAAAASGLTVRIARRPQGMDFNDVLSGSAPRTEERAMIDEAEFDDAADQIAEASDGGEDIADPLAGLVEKSAADPGAAFAPDILERLAALKKGNPAPFELPREDRDLFIAASNGHVLAFERSALARLEQDRFSARTKQGWLLAPVTKQAEVRA